MVECARATRAVPNTVDIRKGEELDGVQELDGVRARHDTRRAEQRRHWVRGEVRWGARATRHDTRRAERRRHWVRGEVRRWVSARHDTTRAVPNCVEMVSVVFAGT